LEIHLPKLIIPFKKKKTKGFYYLDERLFIYDSSEKWGEGSQLI
jgi:hypothetical protein